MVRSARLFLLGIEMKMLCQCLGKSRSLHYHASKSRKWLELRRDSPLKLSLEKDEILSLTSEFMIFHSMPCSLFIVMLINPRNDWLKRRLLARSLISSSIFVALFKEKDRTERLTTSQPPPIPPSPSPYTFQGLLLLLYPAWGMCELWGVLSFTLSFEIILTTLGL